MAGRAPSFYNENATEFNDLIRRETNLRRSKAGSNCGFCIGLMRSGSKCLGLNSWHKSSVLVRALPERLPERLPRGAIALGGVGWIDGIDSIDGIDWINSIGGVV